MKTPHCTTVDFETEAIGARPDAPRPVGVSIKEHGKKPKYYAWGHPTKNNCTEAQAKKALKKVWKDTLLFFNAKFDIDVAMAHMGVPFPKDFHDAMFLVFLDDPHARQQGLKPSSERVLNLPPEEQDELKDWIIKNVPEAAKKKSTWGAYICRAPGDLTGKYANGDTTRTAGLFKVLYPKIVKDGMLAAYQREVKLTRIFLEGELKGMRVDVPALKRDIPAYQKEMLRADAWLRKKLKNPEINIDSDRELAEALAQAEIVTEWTFTKTGQRSVSKQYLTHEKFKDKQFYYVLGYRNRLATCLRMFLESWLAKALECGGYIHPSWNQVRQSKGDKDSKGTRTGRPSCDNPNFLNVSKAFEDRGDEWKMPTVIKLKPLPLVRNYCLPDKGCEWLHRDYNQQELRIMAHYEDGELCAAYQANPTMDVHTHIQEQTHIISGKLWPRSPIKTTVFGRIYGQGLGSLAERLGMPVDEVKQIRNAQNKALPGLPQLEADIKALAANDEPIITWGGRQYYCEPPMYVESYGRVMTFGYKLINYLIQGSAADITKEALIRWYYHTKRKPTWRFIVTVYDEINICAPVKEAKAAMALLRECMEGIELDVPLLTDGKAGKSWGQLEKKAW